MTLLGWLRQSPLRPNSRHMLEHIERLLHHETKDRLSPLKPPLAKHYIATHEHLEPRAEVP